MPPETSDKQPIGRRSTPIRASSPRRPLSAPDLRTSLLLSTAAYRLQDSADSRSALLAGLIEVRRAVARTEPDNRVQWLGVSADGKRLWTADNRQTVTRFETRRAHRQLGTFPLRECGRGHVTGRAADRRCRAVGFQDFAGVTRGIVLDADTGAVLNVLSVPVASGGTAERTAAFTGDGRWLVVAEGSPPTLGARSNKVAVFDANHLDVPPQ